MDKSRKSYFFLAGNAWTDPDIDNEGAVDFWYSHAIISEDTKNAFKKACNFSHVGPLIAADGQQASVDPEVRGFSSHLLTPLRLRIS